MKIMILGGDGYLGWSIGLDRAFKTDDCVCLVDSYLKRDLQKAVGVEELYPLPFLVERVRHYRQQTGKFNLDAVSMDVSDFPSVLQLVDRIRPDVIINAAQQPSAPLSMMSPEYAMLTLSNNESTVLNTLWAVAQRLPDCLVINLGSAGQYLSIDTEFVPTQPKSFKFYQDAMPYLIEKSWLPMQASDFYHQSKANSFAIADICARLWNLKVVTVQQSTIFGQCVVPELDHPSLYPRLNYDHIFGTVLNRFICQAVSKHPLTVYGDGKDKTNLICLCDTVRAFNKIIDSPINPGEHKVFNNFTAQMSIEDIALKVVELYGGTIEYLENPRKEKESKHEKVFEKGIVERSDGSIDDSIRKTLDFAERFSYSVKTEQFAPTIFWQVNRGGYDSKE